MTVASDWLRVFGPLPLLLLSSQIAFLPKHKCRRRPSSSFSRGCDRGPERFGAKRCGELSVCQRGPNSVIMRSIMVAEGERRRRPRTVNNKIDGLICHSLWEGNKFFRWAQGGGGSIFQFQKSQSISPPLPGARGGVGWGCLLSPPPIFTSHPCLPNIFRSLPFFVFIIFWRVCFFPLRCSSLLTPPTSLFPWRICNPERKRR